MNLLQSFKFDLLVHGKLLIAAEVRLNYQSCLLSFEAYFYGLVKSFEVSLGHPLPPLQTGFVCGQKVIS